IKSWLLRVTTTIYTCRVISWLLRGCDKYPYTSQRPMCIYMTCIIFLDCHDLNLCMIYSVKLLACISYYIY
ncbi:hypothetical protein BDA96_10G003300, partial [Sorghum bicolor]